MNDYRDEARPGILRNRLIVRGVMPLLLIMLIALISIYSAEKYTGRAEFCGTKCHIMKPNWESYKKDRHSEIKVLCIDCHYAPGEKPTARAKYRGLGQLFSYLSSGDKEVRKRARVDDLSCTAQECHPRESFLNDKIEYKKAYKTGYKGIIKPFLHKTHLEKPIEGQRLHCTSCHMHASRNRHMEVPKELCFLCHFRRSSENRGRAKCDLCHEIPEKPINGQNSHQKLMMKNLPCSGCHLAIVNTVSRMKTDLCTECHHDASPELLAKRTDKRFMHETHITRQSARCFQCHEKIEHRNYSLLDRDGQNCEVCHPKPHALKAKKKTSGANLKQGGNKLLPKHGFRGECIKCHDENFTRQSR